MPKLCAALGTLIGHTPGLAQGTQNSTVLASESAFMTPTMIRGQKCGYFLTSIIGTGIFGTRVADTYRSVLRRDRNRYNSHAGQGVCAS